MWKCPECGSFMVFGEDGDRERFTFYERQEAEQVEPLFDPNQELNLVVVEFQEGGNGYTYICDDPNIHIRHAVVVPVGKENTEKTALVVQKYHALPKDITCLLYTSNLKMKQNVRERTSLSLFQSMR